MPIVSITGGLVVRRVLGILLILLGTASIVLGVLSATSWRTSDTVTATSSPAEVPLVLIEPGVAGIVDPVVDITITPAEPTQTVTLITARDADAEGWIADAAVQRIENLADWTELVTSTTEGVQEIPDPTVSDMWIKVEQVEGTLELDNFRAPEDRTVLLIARDGASGPAPTVSFTWQRDVATPYLMPLVGAGIAAVVLGIGLVVSSFVGRTPRREDEAEQVEPSEGQGCRAPRRRHRERGRYGRRRGPRHCHPRALGERRGRTGTAGRRAGRDRGRRGRSSTRRCGSRRGHDAAHPAPAARTARQAAGGRPRGHRCGHRPGVRRPRLARCAGVLPGLAAQQRG
ncbi:hypothetical protein [Salana multivorans]